MRNKDKLIEDLWMQELDPYNDYEQIKGDLNENSGNYLTILSKWYGFSGRCNRTTMKFIRKT